MSLIDLQSLIPELILTITACGLLFVRSRFPQIALSGLLAAGVSLAFVPWGSFFFGAFEIDALALLFKALFLGVALFVALGSPGTVPAERAKEYYALLLFATIGMMGVAGATELITLFVSFELSSLSTYALAGYIKRDERSLEAAIKFFIIGALSSALSLYGISLLYGVANTTAIRDLATMAARSPDLALAFKTGMILVLAGFGFKITLVPFHLWAPDVYEGAPAPITALLAAGSKKMGFLALIKIFLVGATHASPLQSPLLDWGLLLGVLALLTMTVGNLLALVQPSVKRMLAYSSIAHAGYILIAFPVATEYGLMGGLFQIVTHAITTAGLFLVVALIAAQHGPHLAPFPFQGEGWGEDPPRKRGAGGEGFSEDYAAYQGLSRRQPFIALVTLLSLLSLAGVPPLPGFQSKFVLFSSAVDAALTGEHWLILLAIGGILNSALSLAFYARLIKAMYVEEPIRDVWPYAPTANPHAEPEKSAVPPLLLVALVLELAFIIVIAFHPEPLLAALRAAARAVGL